MGAFGGGGGGFFGSGAKTSQSISEQTTETTNVSGGASEGSFNISAHGAVNLVDPGLVEQAFRFASESLGLVQQQAGNAQQAFENALSSTLNTSDAERTGNSKRLYIFAGAALAAFILYAYVVKR